MKNWFNKLPIKNFATQVAKQLSSTNACVLTSPTGTGKTIYLPLYLSQNLPSIKQVWVSQPRITQAESNAMSAIEGSEAPSFIGHITGRGTTSNTDAKVLYMTEGIATGKLQNITPQEIASTLFIIDEAHELELSTIINLNIARRKGLMTLVMSATVEGSLFANYLNCEIVEATTVSYKVEGSPVYGDIRQKSSCQLNDTSKEYLEAGYSFVVIVQGKAQIEKAHNYIAKWALDKKQKVNCYPMHGELDSKERLAYLNHKEQDGQAVIIATNIARTGLTYPSWVRGVIDAGTINHMVNEKGVNTLTEFTISQAEVKQAAGRVGRIAPKTGDIPYIYTLCNSTPYAEMNEYPLRAVDILDARSFALSTLAADIKNQDLVTPYETSQYNSVVEELVENGVIKINGHIEFTEKGKKIAPLLSVMEYNQAITMYYAMRLGIAKEIAKTMAVSSYTKFGSLMSKKSQENTKDLSNFYTENWITSQAWANILMLNNCLEVKNLKGKINKLNPAKDAKAIAELRGKLAVSKKFDFIDFNAEKQALEGYRKIKQILRNLGYKGDTQKATQENVSLVIVLSHRSNRYTSSRRGWGTGSDRMSRVKNENKEYDTFSYIAGDLKNIKGAVFFSNPTYFDNSLLEKAFEVDSSLFVEQSSYTSENNDVVEQKTTYYFNNNSNIEFEKVEVVAEPAQIFEIAKSKVSISLPAEVQELNKKLALLKEPTCKVEDIEIPAKLATKSISETKANIEQYLADVFNNFVAKNSYVNELLPNNENLEYRSDYILQKITNPTDPKSLSDKFEGVEVKFIYKGTANEVTLEQIEKDYNAHLEQISKEKARAERLAKIESYSVPVKINFKSYMKIDDLFYDRYDNELSQYIYHYVDADFNKRLTTDRDVYVKAQDKFQDLVLTKQLELLQKDNFRFIQEIEGDFYEFEADTTQERMIADELNDCLENNRYNPVSLYHFTKRANGLWEQLNQNNSQNDDLAAKLKEAFGGVKTQKRRRRR